MDFAAILKKYDDPRYWEYPPDFDCAAAAQRFEKFANSLSLKLGFRIESETGGKIQDASFHSQIFLPLGNDSHAVIRFSNFGDLSTVSDEETVPAELLRAVVALLESHGYIYVPVEVLCQPYTGLNPGVDGIRSWWVRYFDWV